ncbi:MAG: efflux system, outer rane lipoprotein NodT family [Caulobacteraceae bacterium]|nr:efflux system, outer rane lipoprotein NodT family [Caulobacteraceae bacterium]
MPALGTRISDVRLFRGLLTAAALAPLLAACATGSVRTADTRLPAAYAAPQPQQTAPAAALDQWWTLYNDAQLTALVQQALANSPDARDAASKLDQARAVRQAALYAYNPQGALSASASKSKYNLLDPGASSAAALGSLGGLSSGATGVNGASLLASESYSLGFNVSWELDLFGRRRAARRSADAELRNAEFTYDATRWSLAANVADSLFQARGLAIQLDQANETLRIERQLYDVSKARVDHGLAPSSDAAQTESNLQSAQAQAEALGAQLNAARRQLLLLVGRGVDPLASLPVPAEVGAPPPVPAALPGELLIRRPDVREAQQRVESAAGKLTLNKRALLPTFTLSPGVGLLQEGASAAGRLSFWSLAASAAMPVLDRPRLLSLVHQQRDVAEQAVIAYEKSVQTAYGDAENAFGYYDSDKRRVALLIAAEKNANFAYQAKQTGYRRGLNDLQSTLTAEANWRQARVSLASAQVTLMQRSVQVFKALGGGWSPDTPIPRLSDIQGGAAG